MGFYLKFFGILIGVVFLTAAAVGESLSPVIARLQTKRVLRPETSHCQARGKSELTQTELDELDIGSGKSGIMHTVVARFQRPQVDIDLKSPGTDLRQVFQVIAMSPAGARKLRDFVTPYQKRTIEITQVTDDEMEKLEPGRDATAVFVPQSRTIYLRKSVELGIQAPALLHEIVHSLDSELYFKAKACNSFKAQFQTLRNAHDMNDNLTPEEEKLATNFSICADVLHFKSERIAYSKMFDVVSELLDRVPCYGEYLSIHSRGEIIKTFMSNQDIVDSYIVDRRHIFGVGLKNSVETDPAKAYNIDLPQPPDPLNRATH